MGTLDESRLEEGWLVCLGRPHTVRDGMVRCAIAGRRVLLDECLACRHLETLAGERDGTSCAAPGLLSPPPPPR